jgi:hypothetical protein
VLRLPKSRKRTQRWSGATLFGAIDVLSAEEFYKNADEHFSWAESAKTERERAIFLQMAAAWLEVAQKWEAANMDAPDRRQAPLHSAQRRDSLTALK